MSGKSKARLFRQFDRLERHVPSFAARILEWLRRPGARLVRIPLGLLMIAGGVFSFLPVLGAWMLPLGLLLLAIDVPVLRGPVNAVTVWGSRKWTTWRRKRRDRKAERSQTPSE
jgi:hypothetical protein